mgnify:CR=1 FL=1
MTNDKFSNINEKNFNIYYRHANKIAFENFKILEGEYYNYYSFNLRTQPFKFLFFFLKKLFFKEKYTFDYKNNSSKILNIKTASYIYEDNLTPVSSSIVAESITGFWSINSRGCNVLK